MLFSLRMIPFDGGFYILQMYKIDCRYKNKCR